MGLIVVACGLSDSIKVVPTDQFEKIMNYDMAVVLKKNLSHKTENKVFNKVKNHRTIKDAVKVFSSDVKIKKIDMLGSLKCVE